MYAERFSGVFFSDDPMAIDDGPVRGEGVSTEIAAAAFEPTASW